MLNAVKTPPAAISGHLETYSGQETEGLIYWAVAEQGKPDLAGLNALKKGDVLTIFNQDLSDVVWKGVVDFDYKRNMTGLPNLSQVGVQHIGGTLVHGIQKGVHPEAWMGYFRAHHPCTLERVPS